MSNEKHIVIYHANCMDGYFAAFAHNLRYKGVANITYVPSNYGDDIPRDLLVKDVTVFVLDFSFPLELSIELTKLSKEVAFIDHHKTFADQCNVLNDIPNAHVYFDIHRSGAALAWDFFHHRKPPQVFEYVQDRDLWRFELPNSNEINTALYSCLHSDVRSKQPDFRDVSIYVTDWDRCVVCLINEGIAIERYKKIQLLTAAETAAVKPFADTDIMVPHVFSPILQSELGNMLCKGYPFAVIMTLLPNTGEVRLSLRSDTDGMDVSEIAKEFGGGGHRHAAGFTLSAEG